MGWSMPTLASTHLRPLHLCWSFGIPNFVPKGPTPVPSALAWSRDQVSVLGVQFWFRIVRF